MFASLETFVLVVAFSGVIWLCNAGPPSWNEPNTDSGQHNISTDLTTTTACNNVQQLEASNLDGSPTEFAVTSQDPDGGFTIIQDDFTFQWKLTCDTAMVLAANSGAFIVEVSATDTDDNTVSPLIINIKNTGVTAANDADPTFSNGTAWTKEVARDAFENDDKLLWTTTVSDADGDSVTLSIPDTDYFILNGDNIEIVSSLSSLNSPHDLVITATDTGDPARSSSFILTIVLIHHTPVLLGPQFTDPVNGAVIDMCETDYEGDDLATLVATDEDDGDVDILVFELTMVNDVNDGLFTITNNVLMVNTGVQEGTFNVENPDNPTSYAMKLSVSDGKLSSMINITVQVEDFNDNEPIFSGTWTVHLLDSATIGTVVYEVTVTDADITDENKNFIYEISGSDQFAIDEGGKISLNDATEPNLNFGQDFTLTVTVNDTDDPETANTVSETLNIIIDTAPEFRNLNEAKTVNVTEGAPVGDVVYTFDVLDRDNASDPLEITIASESEAGVFEINGTTLVTMSNLDVENIQSYTLTFRCSDGTYQTNSEMLTIDVLDENDHSPLISEISDVTIPENLPIGSDVVAVAITDNDLSSPNKDITWEIKSGNEDSYFDVNMERGYIILAAKPVSTTTDRFLLVISASDGGTPAQTTQQDVTIIINADSIDDCEDGPCQQSTNCEQYVNDFICTCSAGWKDKTCDTECSDNKFGLNCANDCNCNASHVAADAQDQTCNPVDGTCICNDFWMGDDCETDVNECDTANICNEAEHRTCDNSVGSYDCICVSGYREIESICQEDECLLDPCSNGGTCLDTMDGFTCECTPGWQVNTNCTAECAGNKYGQDCEDDCNCNASHVAADAQDQMCNPVDGTCICNDFWMGDDCETDVNECGTANICNETEHRTCDNSVGSYDCICVSGYREIESICQEDECLLDPCSNGGTCLDTMDGFTCECTPGWQVNTNCTAECAGNKYGQDCEDDCNCNASHVAADAQDQMCNPVDGTCICNDFWMGDDCETDVNECGTANICNETEHRTCDNSVGSYDCICVSGYREIESICQEDECLLDPCSNGGTCLDTMDGFTCECTPGWQVNTNCTAECAGNKYGQDCEDDCNCNASHVAADAQDQMCNPVDGTCICNDFWMGDDCETDVNECGTANICNETEHRTCDNSVGSYDCICVSGYREIESICQEDECLLDPCSNGGTCLDTMDGFTCECTPGWQLNTNCTAECAGNKYGQDCEDDCNCTASHVAANAQNQMCIPVNGTCICNEFWTGDDCETDVNECDIADTCDVPAHRVCINGAGNYSCVCEQGYRELGTNCEYINVKIPPGQLHAKMTLPVKKCPNLRIPSVYNETKEKLEQALSKRLNKVPNVYNITCSSIVFKTVFPSNKTFEERVKLIDNINALKETGTLEYDGDNVTLVVNSAGFTSADGDSSSTMSVLDTCDDSVCYRCETSNAVFKCRMIEDDNQALIWGLLGFVLSTIVIGSMIVLAVICYQRERANRRKITRHRRHDQMPKKSRYNSDRSFSQSTWYNRKYENGPHVTRSDSFVDPYTVSPYSVYNGRGFQEKHFF